MLTNHDTYCRCRICKPPLPGEAQARRDKFALAVIIILALVAAIMVAKP